MNCYVKCWPLPDNPYPISQKLFMFRVKLGMRRSKGTGDDQAQKLLAYSLFHFRKRSYKKMQRRIEKQNNAKRTVIKSIAKIKFKNLEWVIITAY